MIESYGESHVGLRRRLNEDSLLLDDDLGLFVVADGMGGHNAGEIASRIAVETVANFVLRSREEEEITWPYGVDPKLSWNANRILTSVMLANKRVWKEADKRQDYTGMGTTITAALLDDEAFYLVSAGDSRAYRLRNGVFEQLTVDDSWVQAAVDEGVLLAEEAHGHPMKNIITKAIGAKENIDLAVQEHPVQDNDLFLLCSDGLHGMVPGERLSEMVRNGNGTLPRLIERLIGAANDNGGRDNVTALAVRYRRS
ncbi:MAG TPA: protein phosphatase 2C domain-containing protein [Vicinamibacteria bacterium]|nr:protein phosphatase 2C domain-containing protein [Vicinamibacteria bacterium]